LQQENDTYSLSEYLFQKLWGLQQQLQLSTVKNALHSCSLPEDRQA
jgi:hypothetical protein